MRELDADHAPEQQQLLADIAESGLRTFHGERKPDSRTTSLGRSWSMK